MGEYFSSAACDVNMTTCWLWLALGIVIAILVGFRLIISNEVHASLREIERLKSSP
jgi:hypothetical protein